MALLTMFQLSDRMQATRQSEIRTAVKSGLFSFFGGFGDLISKLGRVVEIALRKIHSLYGVFLKRSEE